MKKDQYTMLAILFFVMAIAAIAIVINGFRVRSFIVIIGACIATYFVSIYKSNAPVAISKTKYTQINKYPVMLAILAQLHYMTHYNNGDLENLYDTIEEFIVNYEKLAGNKSKYSPYYERLTTLSDEIKELASSLIFSLPADANKNILNTCKQLDMYFDGALRHISILCGKPYKNNLPTPSNQWTRAYVPCTFQ